MKKNLKTPLTNLIYSDSIKGDSKKWALQVENLHNYKPNSVEKNITNKPMWR